MKVLDCPLVILRFPPCDWLAVLIDSMVVIISKDEPVVIQGSSFTNAEEFGFCEGEHLHGTSIFVGVLVAYLENLMCLKVDDVDLRLRNVADYHFFVVDLTKKVNDIVVLSLEENTALCVEVNYALLLTRLVNSDEDEGSFVGSGSTEDLIEGLWKFDSMFVLK